jgi:ABC-type iron transport system FetAB ATPase subunit
LTALRLENLTSRAAGDGHHAAARITASLSVAAGECVCISGASGSGKTLLLRAIADLDPSDGRVYLGDEERFSMSGAEWRRRVSFLPAESAWWADTVAEHFPAGEPDFLGELGFEPAVMGRQVARLSTGERQRLAVLRQLSTAPQALLLDEPTASLDPANSERVEALLARFRRETGAAVVWVSHDPRQIQRVANRHLRIHGDVLEDAPLASGIKVV